MALHKQTNRSGAIIMTKIYIRYVDLKIQTEKTKRIDLRSNKSQFRYSNFLARKFKMNNHCDCFGKLR